MTTLRTLVPFYPCVHVAFDAADAAEQFSLTCLLEYAASGSVEPRGTEHVAHVQFHGPDPSTIGARIQEFGGRREYE